MRRKEVEILYLQSTGETEETTITMNQCQTSAPDLQVMLELINQVSLANEIIYQHTGVVAEYSPVSPWPLTMMRRDLRIPDSGATAFDDQWVWGRVRHQQPGFARVLLHTQPDFLTLQKPYEIQKSIRHKLGNESVVKCKYNGSFSWFLFHQFIIWFG